LVEQDVVGVDERQIVGRFDQHAHLAEEPGETAHALGDEFVEGDRLQLGPRRSVVG
jgi:hypothetical protein